MSDKSMFRPVSQPARLLFDTIIRATGTSVLGSLTSNQAALVVAGCLRSDLLQYSAASGVTVDGKPLTLPEEEILQFERMARGHDDYEARWAQLVAEAYQRRKNVPAAPPHSMPLPKRPNDIKQWLGARVRVRNDLEIKATQQIAGLEIKKGTVARVVGQKTRFARLELPPCECCKAVVYVSVSWFDIDYLGR